MGTLEASPPITIPHISSHDKPREKKETKNKSLNIYLNSERRHEASKVEPLVIEPHKEPFGIGNITPPYVVLNISHGVWGKHELKKVPQNLWVIHTHQLAPYPLYQVYRL